MLERNILWAEDTDAHFSYYSTTLAAFLRDRGIQATITRAVDGDAVYRQLSYRMYDLIVVDIDMPNWNGIDTVKDLEREHPGLPVMIVSGFTSSPDFSDDLSELVSRKVLIGYYPSHEKEAWCEAAWRALSFRAPTILHLSDIHFGAYHALQGNLQIEDLIGLAIKNTKPEARIDLVIVSGDLSSKGTMQEFNRAERFLRSLGEMLGLSLERFIIVPGNHDIYLPEEEDRRFMKFIEFLNGFYGRLPDQSNALGNYPEIYDGQSKQLRWKEQEHREESLYSVSVFDELKTIVIGLNSVIARADDRWKFSKIEPSQLLKVGEALDRLPAPRDDYFRIAVFHHNPFTVPSFTEEGEPERVVRNPTFVLQELIKNRVRLVLHGHTHYSIGFKYVPYYLDRDNRSSCPIHVFGAGTLSGKDLPLAQSYFHLSTIQCSLNQAGSINSAKIISHRLLNDWMSWEAASPVLIDFEV